MLLVAIPQDCRQIEPEGYIKKRKEKQITELGCKNDSSVSKFDCFGRLKVCCCR